VHIAPIDSPPDLDPDLKDLGNPGVKLGNPGVKLGNPGVKLGNPGVKLGNPGVKLGINATLFVVSLG
jgi:hypothetical protein